MSDDPQARLRSHVDAILAQGGVPAQEREPLAEELYGHLLEKWAELVAGGLGADDAAERAVRAFGAHAELASQLRTTYHGRLWASTIGVLLPVVAQASSRPGAVAWLRFVLGLVIALTGVGLIGIPSLTPVRLAANFVVLVLSVACAILAFKALGRGQRWALGYGIGACLVLFVEGIADTVAKSGPSNVSIPLGSILSAVVLLMVLGQRPELEAFVAASRRVPGWLVVLLAIALLAPPIVPRVLAAVPDPTQAGPGDMVLGISTICDRADIEVEGLSGPETLRNLQRVTVVVDATWSRADLLPSGLGGLLDGSDGGDTAGVSLRWDPESQWIWDTAPPPIDVESGRTIGAAGSTSPSESLLPVAVMNGYTFAIDDDEIRAGHTHRMTFVLRPGSGRTTPWPAAEVYYAHLDRFVIAGSAECNTTSIGRPIYSAADASLDGESPLLPATVPAIEKVGIVEDVRIYPDKVRYRFADGSVREVQTEVYRTLNAHEWGGFGLVIVGEDRDGPFVAAFLEQDGLPRGCYVENGIGIERGAYIESLGVLWAKAPGFTSAVDPAFGEAYPAGARFCFSDDGQITTVIGR